MLLLFAVDIGMAGVVYVVIVYDGDDVGVAIVGVAVGVAGHAGVYVGVVVVAGVVVCVFYFLWRFRCCVHACRWCRCCCC